MIPALYVAKTGLSAQDTQLTTLSNNLANVSTTGFKRDRAEFQDLLYQIKRQPGAKSTQDSELPSGLQLGTGVHIVGTQKNFSAGSLQTTGQPLDLAVNGFGTALQRTLETSNVSTVEERVNMITTQRAYEMNSKVISTANQMLGALTQKL